MSSCQHSDRAPEHMFCPRELSLAVVTKSCFRPAQHTVSRPLRPAPARPSLRVVMVLELYTLPRSDPNRWIISTPNLEQRACQPSLIVHLKLLQATSQPCTSQQLQPAPVSHAPASTSHLHQPTQHPRATRSERGRELLTLSERDELMRVQANEGSGGQLFPVFYPDGVAPDGGAGSGTALFLCSKTALFLSFNSTKFVTRHQLFPLSIYA